MSSSGLGPRLRGRRNECAALDRLVEDVRAGQSRVVVLRGEAGVGKTALLEYLLERASGCRIARAAGVESEMELPFAGLHQLCAPMLEHLGRLPGPQGDALGAAFGLREGDAPDRFLVGLAALTPVGRGRRGAAAGLHRRRRPVARPRLGAGLAFVARRLVAERSRWWARPAPVSARRTWLGLPELHVRGLGRPRCAGAAAR